MALFYIIQNLLSILIVLKLRKLYALISLFFFIIIFVIKPDTFDLILYPGYVTAVRNHEFLFGVVIKFISIFVNDPRTTITVYQIFYLISASLILFFFQKSNDKLLILAIILSSVAVMLGVHNNLRQGLACIFILLGIFSYISGYKISAILFFITSQGFHTSSILFVLLIALNYLFYINLYKRFSLMSKIDCMLSVYILSFFLSLIFFFIFVNLIHFVDLLTLNNSKYINYLRESQYAGFRSSLLVKTIFIFCIVLSTEFLMKFQSINFKLDFLRFLRIFILLFCFFLSLNNNFNEIGNRIFYIYYVIEMGLMCYLISKKFYNTTTLILLAYAFAFNVWNIIGGI